MSIPKLPSRSQANPSFSGSLPGFPETTVDFVSDDESLALPDHFPEPYVEPPEPCIEPPEPPCIEPPEPPCVETPEPSVEPTEPEAEKGSSRSSAKLETGQTLVYCCTEQVVKKDCSDVSNGEVVDPEAKEGLRRLTDKYAAPEQLLRNGSVSSVSTRTSTLSVKETLPASPTPTITLSPSPSSSSNSNSNSFPVVNDRSSSDYSKSPSPPVSEMNGRQSADSTSLSVAHPDLNSLSQNVVKRSGSSLGVMSVSAFSDTSSDISDASPSPAYSRDSVVGGSVNGDNSMVGVGGPRYQSVSGIPLTTSLGDGVSEQDVQQVEMFYRSHKSDVTVCHSLANLYIGSVASNSSSPAMPPPANGPVSPAGARDLWAFVTTGIPVFIQDSGEHHRNRQVMVVVAEKGTGFVLWKDIVSQISHYSCPHDNFHTFTLSTDTTKLVGLSFDDSKAASEFASVATQLTQDPDDEGTLTKKGKKKKRQESKRKIKYKAPRKIDISQPCCFQHITKLERPQVNSMMPLPPNVFLPPPPSSSVSSLSDAFQDQLSVSISRARSHSSELSEVSTLASDH